MPGGRLAGSGLFSGLLTSGAFLVSLLSSLCTASQVESGLLLTMGGGMLVGRLSRLGVAVKDGRVWAPCREEDCKIGVGGVG